MHQILRYNHIDIVYFAEGKEETVSFELRTSSNEFSDLLMGAETLIDPEEKMYDQMRKEKRSRNIFNVKHDVLQQLSTKNQSKKPSFF